MYKSTSLYKELDAIRKKIDRNEGISYGEIAFLEENKTEVMAWFPDDLTLWQWAGIPENKIKEKDDE